MAESREREGGRGRLSGDEVSQLAEQIAGLARAGLPLPSGLRALGEELPSRRLRGVLDRLAGALDAGASLDEALAGQGRRLPAHLRGMVAAGARTGRLGETLGRFSGYANLGVDLRRALWMRLTYPLLSFGFASAVFIFVCVVLVTGFEAIFNDFGMPLPFLTRFALAMAHAVERVWWPLLEGLAALAAVGLIARLVLRADVRRGLSWGLPLIGPVFHLGDLSEFCHLLALLLESDVPLLEALPMAGEAIRNSEIASAARAAAREVAEGQPLARALTRRSLFPEGFARILAWAQGHRGLPEALHMAGEMFEARARSQVTFVSSVCGVVVMLTIFGGVATMIVAVILPMMTLISRLSG